MNQSHDITLRTSQLAIGYRQSHTPVVVASDLNLDMHSGTVTALFGANGAGKSTLLRTIAASQPPLAGFIQINGIDLQSMSPRQTAQLLSIVATESTNAGALNVREVVALGRQPYTGFFGRLDRVDHNIVDSCIEEVGIAPLADRYMATLSDGERQKTMIARALAQQTPIMLLDEPTTFLDVASRLEVMALLRTLATTHGKAILLSTHDISEALTIADRLWLFNPSHQIIDGSTRDMIDRGDMDRLFADRNITFDRATLAYRLKNPKNP
ncbi:MAG: ABC transporter ATP-binding protein [Bacteroides sp.]|nr:ABC transporter ATP-binding protein [Bacteroides sp.]MCM1413218.1 ABC transporter ATP-binding protein [Bacteroides sp.]MCM1471472.1 ABC transporter ATP-binding protein [Bacteroides sp.]